MQWIDVLILGREVHGSNTNRVHYGVVQVLHSLILSQVFIEDGYSEEVGTNGALEGCCNFYHPVNHLGAVVFRDGVLVQWAGFGLVQSHQVLVDLCVESQLVIFSLVWGRLLSAHITFVSLLSLNGARVLPCPIAFDLEKLHDLIAIFVFRS